VGGETDTGPRGQQLMPIQDENVDVGQFREAISLAPSIIAIGGVYGFAISVVTQVTSLLFSGNSWALNSLTVSDYLNRAVAPVVASATVAGGYTLMWFYVNRTYLRGRGRGPVIILAVTGIFFTLCLFLFLFVPMPRGLQNFSHSAIYFGTLLVLNVILFTVYLLVPEGRKRNSILLSMVLALPLCFAFVFGAMSGARFTKCGDASLQLIGGGNLKGWPVLNFERGVAMRTYGGVRVIIPWDKIERLTLGSCPAN